MFLITIQSLGLLNLLLQVGNQREVLISIVQVFTTHTPDKGIVMSSGSRMDRPFGRQYSLVTLHPYVAGFVNFAHEVANCMFFGYFKIEVSFHTTAVHMCRHRIPYATRSKFRHTHLQLAGRQYLIHQHLIYITMVGTFQATHFSNYSISLRHFLIGIVAMSSQ